MMPAAFIAASSNCSHRSSDVDMSSSHSAAPAEVFRTTQWTRVLEARGGSAEAKAALSELCAAYYAPVFAFVRHNTRDQELARDLAQEFFARLLGRQGIDTVDPQRGRFRSFLLGAVKHFLADMRDHDQRLKRGGAHVHVSLDGTTDTDTSAELGVMSQSVPDVKASSPDLEFDRKWALTVIERALGTLAEEHRIAGKTAAFEVLKPWLTGDTEALSQAEAGRQLGMNEGAVKVAIHRLRRRFRELVKAEIRQTLRDPAQARDELTCLISALTA
jgi:RNA polymerase sigma-70 factor (ECF subfamily)